jgi:hypothetical protein
MFRVESETVDPGGDGLSMHINIGGIQPHGQ